MIFKSLPIVAFALLFKCLASPLSHTLPGSLEKRDLPLPDDDQFYASPPGFESTALGTILKNRNIPSPISITSISPIKVEQATQLQYRTQNSLGQPSTSVVTVIVPYKADPKKLLAYAWFSDSACPDCNPSISLQTVRGVNNTFYKQQLAPVIAYLNQGWIVSVADDGGPQATFPSGLHAAYGTLDSIRAVLKSGSITGIKSKPTIAINGYSGGGITAAWTSELQPSYAPEITIAGVALGGLVPNFKVLEGLIPTTQSLAYWAPTVFMGLSHDYPNMSQWLDANLVPATADRFRHAEDLCLENSAAYYANDNMGSYFTGGYASWNDSVPSSILESTGIMGRKGTPRTPWYLYSTVGDEISPISLTEKLYNQYCQQGASIFFEENQLKIVTHSDESIAGFSGAFVWLKERMAGISAAKGCQKSSVSRQSILAGSNVLLSAIFDLYLAYLGVPVGLSDDKYQQAKQGGAEALVSAVQNRQSPMATPPTIL